MAERKRVTRRVVSTQSAKKRKKQEWDRQHPRISLGTEYERWVKGKEESEASSHPEFARLLLDCWYEHRPKLPLETTTTRDVAVSATAATSTPAAPGTVQLRIPDISDVEASSASGGLLSDIQSGVEPFSTDSEVPKDESMLTRYEKRAEKTQGSFIRFSLLEDGEELKSDTPYSPTVSDLEEEEDNADLDFDMSLCMSEDCSGELQILPIADDILDFHGPEVEEDEDIREDPSGDSDVRQIDVVEEKKSICFQSSLLELAMLRVSSICQRKQCGEQVSVKCRYTGTAVQLVWTCDGGHTVHTWNSQPKIRRVFTGNLLTSSAILMSGNNFQKVALLSRFLNLSMISATTHQRIQRLFTAPVIDSYYQGMMNETLDKYKGSEIVIAGDGRNDSPGHSAMYCTYTFMEYDTKDILSSVVIDKRMTGLNSNAMEKEGFIRGIQQLIDSNIRVVEVCTDAHPEITAVMREKHPKIKHSYDTWHGAKNLGKKITAVASENKNKELRPWVPDIINHFWWCSQKAKGNEIALIARWRGVLHHVTNVHEWAIGDNAGPAACEHANLVLGEHDEKWLDPGCDAHSALSNIVLSTRLLHNMKFFVNFRHTGELENFHEHILMYASKRYSYTFPMYKARNQLAVIDYQHHKCRNRAVGKDGEFRYCRKYSKRTKQWTAVPIKEKKNYNYITELLSKIVLALESFEGPLPKTFPLEEGDPRLIKRTIADVSPEPTKQLVEKKVSRFQ